MSLSGVRASMPSRIPDEPPVDADVDDRDEVTEATAPEPGRGGRLVAGRYAIKER
jgi:hypothetical protein